MKVYFAADHGGFALKEILKPFVASLGHTTEDCGANTLDMEDDYPVFVQAAAREVAKDPEGTRGVVIGGSGQGEAFAANRIKGVRAVVYYGEPARKQIDAKGKELDMISSTREHNNSNVLSLAGRFLTVEEAKDAVRRWLSAPYDRAERHERRHRMLDEGRDEFDLWNEKKRMTEARERKLYFREGDIFNARLGKNVGYEQDGKGGMFLRPVLVVRKFNPQVFFGVALTTRPKNHPLYMKIGVFSGRDNFAILSQCRLWDSKRLDYRMAHVGKKVLQDVRLRLGGALLYLSPKNNPPLARG